MKITCDIQMPGETLLPPSAEPLPPEGIPPDEAWNVMPPVNPIFTEQTHFTFSGRGMNSRLAQAKWVNEPDFFFSSQFGGGKGIARAESPIWQVSNSQAPLPDAWEGDDCNFFSSRLLKALEDVASAAIEKVPMRIEDHNGNTISDDHFIVDIIRHHAAIDWANSQVTYVRFGSGPPVSSPGLTRMLPNLPDDLTIFRDTHQRSSVYVRRDVKDIITKMRPKFRGIHFGGA